MIKKFFLALSLCLLLPFAAEAQITQLATTGMAAPFPNGTGSPSSLLSCNSSSANVPYIQTDATSGRLWLCDNSSGSWAWDHLISPVLATATTASITGGSYLLGGCTAITTVTVTGAVVGTNSAAASPIFASAPSGNTGLFNLTAWVSAADTVKVQGCAVGTITVPNFTAKVLLY